MLVFEGVTADYGGAAVLREVSLRLSAGEVAALVGPSGAGKSTLARLALGLLRPRRGRVFLGGRPTHRTPVSALAEIGGLVLQNPLLQLLAERVEDELRLGLAGLAPSEREARVSAALAEFGLEGLGARHPLALSEGQRRRVALAAVVVRRPRVLILDEPTLGQDEAGRAALVRLVRRAAAQGQAVLAVSHDPEFVNDACDRVLVLQAGRLTADRSMTAVLSDPEGMAAAGVPLADVPATAAALTAAGRPVRARTVDELLAAVGETLPGTPES